MNDLIIWNSFVWKAETLELKNTLALPNKIRSGWGITSRQEKDPDGISKLYFYITDGSSQIFVVDAETFKIVRSFPVMIELIFWLKWNKGEKL